MKISTIPHIILVGFCLSWSMPSFAVYKCEVDHKISYSDVPCVDGKVLNINNSVPDDANAEQRQIAQEKKKLKQLEDARHKKEAKEEKERQQAARAHAAARKSCVKLGLRKKWASEDAAAATGKSAAKARLKSQRAEEQYQAECANAG